MAKNLAIITARGGSKRIPRKNIRNFHNKPIIAYSIEAALGSELFEEVMVSTDDIEIAGISQKYGAKVPFLRSEKNSDDFASTADVIGEVITKYEKRNQKFDHACCIYPTAPFISAEKLQKSFEILKNNNASSVIPVVKFDYPIQRALKADNNKLKMFYPEFTNSRSQDLEPAYHDVGQFYWFNIKDFMEKKSLYNDNTFSFEIQAKEVQDIDNEEDWEMAEIKYEILRCKVSVC